ncbi:DegV family protein [Chloroflexota bacterium]
MTIKIITDSTSDISTEIVQVLGITVVPGYIHFGKEVYRDGIDISNEAFYQKLISSPFHPTTSEPTPEDLERVYSDYSQETEGIISIHVSKEISKTYNSAIKATKKMKGQCQIEVIDSRLVSIGLSLVVIEAAKLAKAGGSMLNIVEHINKDISKIRMLGVFNTMKYLAKGGRVIKLKSALSRMFQMKPVLTLENGDIVQEGIVHTDSYSRMIDRLYDFVKDGLGTQDLAIAHSAASEQAEELRKRLGLIFNEEKIHITQIGAAIGVHSGPGALFIALRQKI